MMLFKEKPLVLMVFKPQAPPEIIEGTKYFEFPSCQKMWNSPAMLLCLVIKKIRGDMENSIQIMRIKLKHYLFIWRNQGS